MTGRLQRKCFGQNFSTKIWIYFRNVRRILSSTVVIWHPPGASRPRYCNLIPKSFYQLQPSGSTWHIKYGYQNDPWYQAQRNMWPFFQFFFWTSGLKPDWIFVISRDFSCAKTQYLRIKKEYIWVLQFVDITWHGTRSCTSGLKPEVIDFSPETPNNASFSLVTRAKWYSELS